MADLRPDTRAAEAALTALAPTCGEMRTMLTHLTGYSPDGVLSAIELVEQERAIRAASSGETR